MHAHKSIHKSLSLTSSFGDNLQVLGQGPISYRGERQHSDVISLVRSQTLDGDEVGTAHHLLLPLHDANTKYKLLLICVQLKPQQSSTKPSTHLVNWQCAVWGVVDSVAHHLSVWFLWFIPVYNCCCGAQHTTSDLQSKQKVFGRSVWQIWLLACIQYVLQWTCGRTLTLCGEITEWIQWRPSCFSLGLKYF